MEDGGVEAVVDGQLAGVVPGAPVEAVVPPAAGGPSTSGIPAVIQALMAALSADASGPFVGMVPASIRIIMALMLVVTS